MLDGTTETLDNNGTAKAMYNLPSHHRKGRHHY